MTVEFALFLSPEGIALAHRQSAGHWAFIGETRLDVPDLDAALKELHALGVARGSEGFETLLVLPDDQILYTSLTAPTDDPALTTERIEEGLEGLTPYDVPDLVYDYRVIEPDRVKLAVIARETLGEAKAFAEGHGFKAHGFAAMPPLDRFPGLPVFLDGVSPDPELPENGLIFGSDAWGRSDSPASEAEADDKAPPVATSVDDVPEGSKEEVEAESAASVKAAVSSTSDQTKPDDSAEPAEKSPALAGPSKDDTITDADGSEPPADKPETRSEAGGSSDDTGDVGETAKLETESDAAPIAAPMVAPAPNAADDKTTEPQIEDAGRDEGAQKAKGASEAAPDEPAPAKDNVPPTSTSVQDDPDPDPVPGAASDLPIAPKPGKAEKPAAAGVSLRAEKAKSAPNATSASKRRFNPVAPSSPDGRPDAPVAKPSGDASLPAFSARRGKATAQAGDAGRLVGNRSSRLGFGTLQTERTGPVLHPDAEPISQDRSGAAAPAGSRLTSSLSRVRDISRSRAKTETAPASQTAPYEPAKDTATDRSDRAALVETAAPDKSDTSGTARQDDDAKGLAARLTGMMGGRQPGGSDPDPAQNTDRLSASDASLTGGLLARKPAEPSGATFRTGLILTVILLILLAGIAIWSIMFLPSSPVARFFNADDGVLETAAPFEDATPPETVAEVSAADPPQIDDAAIAEEAGAAQITEDTTLAALEPEVTPDPEAAAAPPDLPETPEIDPLADVTEVPDIPPSPTEDTLPDIDAELDLAPLPPLPEELLPSLAETERIYAEDGIWPRTPERPSPGSPDMIGSVRTAAIDAEISGLDAIALPDPGIDITEQFDRFPSPPPFGTEFAVDERGLIDPTPEGILTPEGAFIIAGTPPIAAVQRPIDLAPVTAQPDVPDTVVEDAILGTFRPAQRPDDLSELRERQLLGGLSVTELAGLRPGQRPVSAQEAAASASLFAGADATDGDASGTPDEAGAAVNSGTALAVAASIPPRLRPANIQAIVAAAERATAAQPVPAVAAAPQPQIPSNASVARAATETNAIRLRNVNLIGVTGTPNNRRALVRLPSGRFVRVGVGDRLDGGRVAAIGEATLQYVRSGRNITLEIPG